MENGSQTNTRSQGFWAGLLCRIQPTIINLHFPSRQKVCRTTERLLGKASAPWNYFNKHFGTVIASSTYRLFRIQSLQLFSHYRIYQILCLKSVPSRLSICNSTSSSRLPSFTYILTRVFKPRSLNYLRKFGLLMQLSTAYYTPEISGRTLHDFSWHKISVH